MFLDPDGEMVFIGQISHVLALTEKVPIMQFLHVLGDRAPTTSENVPFGHSMHSLRSTEEYVPEGHTPRFLNLVVISSFHTAHPEWISIRHRIGLQ
jgi:hypothetical protein